MRLPLLALALLVLAAACSSGSLPTPDAGKGGMGGIPQTDAESAYPCGFVGSPKIDECHMVLPAGVPYCGHDMPVPAPFADCKAMPADPGDNEWTWWCCPG